MVKNIKLQNNYLVALLSDNNANIICRVIAEYTMHLYLDPAKKLPFAAPNVEQATATGIISRAPPRTLSPHVYNTELQQINICHCAIMSSFPV